MESYIMSSKLSICVVLASAVSSLAGESLLAQQPVTQPPAVSTSVPNIHASGATAVTNPLMAQQGAAVIPAGTPVGTAYYGNNVVTQPVATAPVSGNVTTYYYYPTQNSRTVFQTAMPGTYYYYTSASAPGYSTPAQTYYTPVRRGFPFGLFRRRFVQPMTPTYTTAAATTAPTYYYTSPGYYYTPTTYYAVPAMNSPAGTFTNGVMPGTTAPVYTPTTYTVPNENLPAGTSAPSATTTTIPSTATTPGATVPSGAVPSSRTIPAPPPVNPR